MKHNLIMLLVFLSISASAQKNITVSGYLTDENSSETLIGATIYDTDTRQGTATNVFGFYSFTLPEGTHSLRFSYVGYAVQTRQLNLRRDTTVNIALAEIGELGEIVIVGEKEDAGTSSTKMGSIDVPVKSIEHTPALLGETDVMRTIQYMPGVQQGSAGSSSIYVRGGGGDENLILLDGAPHSTEPHCQ